MTKIHNDLLPEVRALEALQLAQRELASSTTGTAAAALRHVERALTSVHPECAEHLRAQTAPTEQPAQNTTASDLTAEREQLAAERKALELEVERRKLAAERAELEQLKAKLNEGSAQP